MPSFVNKLTIRVDIVPPSGDPNAGSAPDTWHPLASNIWASIEDLSGRSLELAQLLASESTHRITIRTNPLITASCYVIQNDRLFIADYVHDPGIPFRGVYSEIYCHCVNDGKASPDWDGSTWVPPDSVALEEAKLYVDQQIASIPDKFQAGWSGNIVPRP